MGRSLAQMRDGEVAPLARAIVDVALSGERGLDDLPYHLNRIVQARLSLDDVPPLIKAHGYHWCKGSYSGLASLEPRLRLALATQALAAPAEAGAFWSFLLSWQGNFGVDDLGFLELLARSKFSDLGFAGAELWRIRPSRAVELAREELRDACTTGLVCKAASADGLMKLLPELRAAIAGEHPAWLMSLLRSHVTVGGELAELAFEPEGGPVVV